MSAGLPLPLSLCLWVALAPGCTLHPTEAPGFTGPSELGLSFNVTATPDSLIQNGFTPAAIVVTARGPNGAPVSGRDFDLILQPAFGTLSARTLRTGTDGTGAAIYTAPPASPFYFGGPPTTVWIVASPVGNNRQTGLTQGAAVKVSPPAVPQEQGRPTASVTCAPTSPKVGELVMFDARSSFAAPGRSIQGYFWDFGDGLPQGEEGSDASHVYETSGTYTIVLGVVDDVGRIGSTFKTIVVLP